MTSKSSKLKPPRQMQRGKCSRRKHFCYGHKKLKSKVIYYSKPFEVDTLSEMVRETERRKIKTGRASLHVVKEIVLLSRACDVTATGATHLMSHMFKNAAQQPKFLLSYDGMHHLSGHHGIIPLRVQQWHTHLSCNQQLSRCT